MLTPDDITWFKLYPKKLLGKKGELADGFAKLQADGSTSCGNWIFCQSYNEKGNLMARRGKKDPPAAGGHAVAERQQPVFFHFTPLRTPPMKSSRMRGR